MVCLAIEAVEVEVAGDGEHGAAGGAHEVIGNRAELDTIAATASVAADHDQAGADLCRDVVELRPRLATAQDAGELYAAVPMPGHDRSERLAALVKATVVEIAFAQLADVDQGDPRGCGDRELDGQLEGVLRAVAEVGAGDELSKGLHGLTMPRARVQCCQVSVGSGPATSNPCWIGASASIMSARVAGPSALEVPIHGCFSAVSSG